jgi:predicted 2-oxoglutarate/Fe(II)-dependent dioxygenase YbiX
MTKEYIVTAHVNCDVWYQYLVKAEDEYNAVFELSKSDCNQIESLDHEVMSNNKIISIQEVKEAYK